MIQHLHVGYLPIPIEWDYILPCENDVWVYDNGLLY